MASAKHKSRISRENPNGRAPGPPAGLAAVFEELPTDGDDVVDRGSRFALVAWLVVFIILGSVALLDLIAALLFR